MGEQERKCNGNIGMRKPGAQQVEGVMYCLEIMECSMLEGFSITTTTQCVHILHVFDSNRRRRRRLLSYSAPSIIIATAISERK